MEKQRKSPCKSPVKKSLFEKSSSLISHGGLDIGLNEDKLDKTVLTEVAATSDSACPIRSSPFVIWLKPVISSGHVLDSRLDVDHPQVKIEPNVHIENLDSIGFQSSEIKQELDSVLKTPNQEAKPSNLPSNSRLDMHSSADLKAVSTLVTSKLESSCQLMSSEVKHELHTSPEAPHLSIKSNLLSETCLDINQGYSVEKNNSKTMNQSTSICPHGSEKKPEMNSSCQKSFPFAQVSDVLLGKTINFRDFGSEIKDSDELSSDPCKLGPSCKPTLSEREIASDSTFKTPPLVMKLSNLPSQDRLDNKHGGGGIETTEFKDVAVKLKSRCEQLTPDVKYEPSVASKEQALVIQTSSLYPENVLNNDSLKTAEFEEKLDSSSHQCLSERQLILDSVSKISSLAMQSSKQLSHNKFDTSHVKVAVKVADIFDTLESILQQIPPEKKPRLDSASKVDSHVIQLPNQPSNGGLGISHVEGCLKVTELADDIQPPLKKQKVSTEIASENLSEGQSWLVDPIMCNEEQSPSNLTSTKDDHFLLSDTFNHFQVTDSQNSGTPETIEFDILDECQCNDPNDHYFDDSDISLDEIDSLLEAGLLKKSGHKTEDKDADADEIEDIPEHEEKEKVILKVIRRDHFDVLPEGWIEVTHNSGIPIYLHKQSRVCCASKPYFLGPGSIRKHEIPISAIPCLQYLREKEKDESESLENTKENNIFPSAKLESVKDNKESGSLDYMAVHEYCKKRFEFQTITVKRFKTWSGRRRHQKELKQRPSLPDSTKLITCPLPASADDSTTAGSCSKREFIMNPVGKSPVCILHEYVQHTLRVQPRYIFKELENASTPYGATVIINKMEYGYGYGSSKKQAKSEAARAALNILIPNMRQFSTESQNGELQDVEFFDQVRIEDPRICDLSVKAGQPYPYQILLECLKRNHGMGNTEILCDMSNVKHQKNSFWMAVGKHKVTVFCKNKKDGKHKAAQAILQLLHPQLKTWGSLLRMYGKGSCKTLKEKKEEEQRITELQSKACANKPNMSILNKLKAEMAKHRDKMKSKKPIGKLIPERMEHISTSDSDLRNVEL